MKLTGNTYYITGYAISKHNFSFPKFVQGGMINKFAIT